MRKIYLFNLPLLLLFLSCAVPVGDPYGKPQKPSTSATIVVNSFLQALKEQDFDSAYDKIHIFSSDREGYASRFRLLYEEYGIRIIDYRVLATQLFKDTAIVVAEVSVDYNRLGESERITSTYRNRYDLVIHEGKWKIVKDTCIENCAYGEETEEEGEKSD